MEDFILVGPLQYSIAHFLQATRRGRQPEGPIRLPFNVRPRHLQSRAVPIPISKESGHLTFQPHLQV